MYYNRLLALLSFTAFLTYSFTFAMDKNDASATKYQHIADKVLNAALNDSNNYARLSYFCDTFGPRLSGSESLNKSLHWIYDQMVKDGLENVHMEEVYVPHWVRGNEYCELVNPRAQRLHMLGLGGSIATPREGITAEVIIVKNYEELDKRASEVPGKIVLFNYPYKGYGDGANYRVHGAAHAAKYGAVASLIRSVTPMANQNAHTGVMFYDDSILKIPHAAISPEEANMIERMALRGQNPKVHLYMEAQTLPDALSYNVMSEIKGTEHPEDVIVIGGHTDSWDVGTGAHDDASGALSAWEAVKLLKDLGIKPKKTIRAVMFVNEENGTRGGNKYLENHKSEKHSLVFEFDSGCFPPNELGFTGPDSLFNDFRQYEPYFQGINKIEVKKGGGGVDIGPMMRSGVPGMSLNTDDNDHYFWYHHSATDTVDKINPDDYKRCIAAMALAVYFYSEMP